MYQFLTTIASPVIDLYLLRRKKSGKEDAERFSERLGYAGFPRPQGKLIWIHAASVGESLSVLPLIKCISETYSDFNILLTTGTTSSASLIESKLPDRAFHQYVPVDRSSSVRRFLKHWKPDAALWVESELWPNLVTETSHYCPMILLNGRISDASYKRWKRYKSMASKILSCFSLVLPQSENDASRLEELGARNISYVGNIKYDAPALPADPKKMGELVSEIGDRQIWMAASTHPGEEAIAARVHQDIQEHHPNLLTVIVPRHPKRTESILQELSSLELNISVRSRNQHIDEKTDIYLADTLGELGIFYRLTPIALIGGSLVEHGGQNPLEAARLETAVIVGPYMGNFSQIKREFEQQEALIKAKDENDLREKLDDLIADPEKQDKITQNALKIVEENSGVLDNVIKEIAPYLDNISQKKAA